MLECNPQVEYFSDAAEAAVRVGATNLFSLITNWSHSTTVNGRELEREQARQAQEAGCHRLAAGGSAYSFTLKRDVGPEEATHTDAPFLCRGCLSDALLRKCAEKIDHFAHHARISPTASYQSDLHRDCLREIRDALDRRFPEGKWATNREIPANPKERLDKVVPDVSGRCGEQRLVIEAQASTLSITQIIKRSCIYTKRGIPIIWVLPLTEPLGDAPFRPRLFERYLHSLNFGRVYYWQPGFGAAVLPVHFSIAERSLPYTQWFDVDDGEERQAGGYRKAYKVIRQPIPAQMLDLASGFGSIERGGFRPWNERKRVPPLTIWQDTLDQWWDAKEGEVFRQQFREDNPALIIGKRPRRRGKRGHWTPGV